MKRALAVLTLATLLCGPAIAAGQNLPEYYPEEYERIGVFNGIDSDGNYLVISDIAVPLGESLRVLTPYTPSETARYLRTGMVVGIKFREDRSEPVTEIWVMP